MARRFKVMSWNVNGLRACTRKGFEAWLATQKVDVLGLQEVRALPEQIPEQVRTPKGWHTSFACAERKGYSGVGLYARRPPEELVTSLGEKRFDVEGRLQIARFGALTIANVYFPNGNGKDRDNSRIPYKLSFYRKLFNRLKPGLRAGEPILVMGDFNTAHEEIDLARPKQNVETSGFRPEERAELTRWVKAGWVDTFRRFESGPGHYSWWSQRAGARERNVGWRIDYVMASPGAEPYLKAARIWPDVMGSDHCPISVELDRRVLSV